MQRKIDCWKACCILLRKVKLLYLKPVTVHLVMCGGMMMVVMMVVVMVVMMVVMIGESSSQNLNVIYEDIQGERRVLAVRRNMVARRFARGTAVVKIIIFRAVCQSFISGDGCGWAICFEPTTYYAYHIIISSECCTLPRFCSALRNVAEARVDGFHAKMGKKTSSLLQRMRSSHNSVLNP